MFTKEYEIKFYEVDFKNQLKESVLLNFLQDIAAVHAEHLGFGYSHIETKNLGWFLLKYHMKFFEWPQNISKIKIKTWPRGIFKLSCIRDFEVYTIEGKKIAAVSSSWVLIDLETKKIANPAKVLNGFEFSADVALDSKFPKIDNIEKSDICKMFDVRYDDIDINQHANNANYLIWALEGLWFEFRAKNQIKELEIQYKKEIKYGSKVLSEIEFLKESKVTLHSIKTDQNEECCKIKITWN